MSDITVFSFEYLMGRWRPTIGDPTFMGWFTVGSYYACAVIALLAALINKNIERRSFFFWSMVCVIMLLLGINKQFNVQSLITEMGRQIARAYGWLDQRGTVQFWLIIVLGSSSAAMLLWFTIAMNELLRRFTLAFTGLLFLISFIIIRAVSLHSFDMVIQSSFLSIKMNWLFELTGIYMVGVAGFKECFQARKRKPS